MVTLQTAAPRNAPSGVSGRLPYLPGLDGLRALAVFSVLLYHGGYSWMAGGFLGVEVFFVISGYLITSLLLAEWRDDNHISLGRFWIRRARRLLPALFVLLVGVLLIGVIFLPDEVAGLRGDVLASVFYVNNWAYIFTDQSYFEVVGRPSLVAHLWSLAVEEQFYLLWPLLFVGGMKLLGRRWFPVLVVAGAIGSAVLMAALFDPSGGDPSRVYYGTDTRAAGLLFGCALAFVWAPWRLRPTVGRGMTVAFDVIGIAALAVLVHMLIFTDEFSSSLYRGGFLRLDLVTLVVIAVIVHPAAHLGRWMGIAPLRWLGLRSYGIYLFHWPVFQLTRPGLDVDLDGPALFALRLAITLALAELSYRFVELPIRKGALSRRWADLRGAGGYRKQALRRRWATALVGAFALIVPLAVMAALAERPAPPDYLAVGSTGPIVAVSDLPDTTTTTAPPTTTTTLDPAATTTVAPAPVVTEPPPPTPTITIPEGATITAIGDSVMLGAVNELRALGPGVQVDAAVSRQVQTGIEMLMWYRDLGVLGETVVVHLGNNGTFTAAQFDQLVEVLQGHRIVFITVKVPRGWQDSNNQVIIEGARRHGGVQLLDWKGGSDNHPEFFHDDGMHLKPEGARFYADMVGYLYG